MKSAVERKTNQTMLILMRTTNQKLFGGDEAAIEEEDAPHDVDGVQPNVVDPINEVLDETDGEVNFDKGEATDEAETDEEGDKADEER